MDFYIWQKLRQPFALPADIAIPHKCKWEMFAFNSLGCLLCSRVHTCTFGNCQDTYEVGDGTVCALSGVVINRYNFQVNEWDHNYPTYAVKSCAAVRNKPERNIELMVNKAISELVQTTPETASRTKLCNMLTKQVCTTIAFFSSEMGMKIKSVDFRNLSIGMLYLMKTGVRLNGLDILPAINQLHDILPPESQLQRRYNFRCKYITDVENKMKLLLRDINTKQLEKVCWNLSISFQQQNKRQKRD